MAELEAAGEARGRSVAGIVFDGTSFLLGKRAQSGEMGGRWEFIGGKAEAGETPQEALVREFKEEIGFAVSPGELICAAEFESASGRSDLYAISAILPADFSVAGASLPEHTELRWFAFEEIGELNLVDSDRKLLPGIEKWKALSES